MTLVGIIQKDVFSNRHLLRKRPTGGFFLEHNHPLCKTNYGAPLPPNCFYLYNLILYWIHKSNFDQEYQWTVLPSIIKQLVLIELSMSYKDFSCHPYFNFWNVGFSLYCLLPDSQNCSIPALGSFLALPLPTSLALIWSPVSNWH